jgi:hypothetical protein
MKNFLDKIKSTPESITFQECIEVIDSNYDFTPTKFKNGENVNGIGQNNGSCKVFSFAKMNKLDKEQTLNLFGDFYRKDVLENPDKDDHQNIRNFIRFGWNGIIFSGEALALK